MSNNLWHDPVMTFAIAVLIANGMESALLEEVRQISEKLASYKSKHNYD